jgi:hypothetical protein
MIDLTTNSGDMKKDNEREEEDRVMSEELIPRLMNNTYQDYFEEDGEIIAGREDNYKAFVWFVKNVLSAINFERNNKRAKKVYDEEDPNFISGVYSVTDEAFGLLMLKNYEKRWRNQVKFPRYKLKDLTKEEKYMAQFTSSLKGNAKLSWSGEGIRQYNEWMDKVEWLRGRKKKGVDTERFMLEKLEKGQKGSRRGKNAALEHVPKMGGDLARKLESLNDDDE